MELFIPSLLVLLIAGLLAFLIIPRSTVPVVLAVSLLILLYVLHDHYGKFYNEYRYSTWQYTARGYAPYVIVAVLILFILTTSSFTLHSSGGQPQVQTPTLPSATSATNPITSVINSGIRAVSSTAAAATTAVTNTVAAATTAVKNVNKNSGSAYNISALLGSSTKNS